MAQVNLYRRLRRQLAASPDHPITRAYRSVQQMAAGIQTRMVPIDRLLCGGEQGMDGRQLALHTGDKRRTSTPICQSPHSKFLTQYQRMGEALLEPEALEQTDFYRNAALCMRTFGSYFDLHNEADILLLARNLIARFENRPYDHIDGKSRSFSLQGLPVTVRPIRYSNCYQVVDGHHRLAIACAQGKKDHRVRVIGPPQLTCLQQLLLDVSWNLNKRDLYQPVCSPELGDQWQLVRRCSDRLDMMKRFLAEHDLLPPQTRTYLDIACNYGWFVKEMGELGYEVQGLEMDWAARQIGIHFYGLHEDQITRGEVVRFFRSNPPKRDVVSCFSLLHHFVLGLGAVGPQEIMHWLDQITDQVLFLDMGEEKEAWFHQSLAGWNPTTIPDWILKNSTFKQVIPLGMDQDRVRPFEDCYGRTTFACMRQVLDW